MAEDESGKDGSQQRSNGREQDIAKRRDALLAEARGEKKPAGMLSGADPRLMGLGIQFVIAILLSLYAGMWVDGKLKTTPWFTLIGGMLGAGAGFYSMYSALMSENKKYEKKDDGSSKMEDRK